MFDLDGTLVDTAPDLSLAANLVRQDLGLEPLPLANYRHAASGGARGLLKVALDITPDAANYAARKERFLFHYRTHLSNGSRLFDGIPEMLKVLESTQVRWGVVTNKIAEFSRPLMADLGLSARSACLVCGDCTPNPKPAPDPLLLAAQLAGVAPRDCIYVGDDERDILAGQAAHMFSVAAGWGYMGEKPDPTTWGADLVVDTPAQLVQMLELRRAA